MSFAPVSPLPSSKKRALAMSDSPTSWQQFAAADQDDDGEEILVEEEPLPHEIATDPVLRCRYPSKHCLRTRTVKKTGALHSMCAFHRAKANRNQRRLEKRKRMRLAGSSPSSSSSSSSRSPDYESQRGPSRTTTVLMPTFSSEEKHMLDGRTHPTAMLFQSPREVAADLEPFLTPAPLYPEDLEELCQLVDVNVRQIHCNFSCDFAPQFICM
ncbi:hypothetical protein BBJ28_00019116 [Nothophytophthora sp. Chile5]|nr:hypothetical protein BBJ28_00019116 [Nothophytophthora sp. Chile5]